jgi:uncharacterized UBP type Zn finger protein
LVHSGNSSDFGHYYCYIKKNFDFWILCNDEEVRKVNINETFSKNFQGNDTSYMLFYIQKKYISYIFQKIEKNDIFRFNEFYNEINSNSCVIL